MKFVTRLLTVCLPILAFSTESHAIPASYGTATHDTTNWQELADPLNSDPFGITWSIDGGSWGRDSELSVGQSVQFRFNMHKQNVGTHYADILKGWLDWGQDGQFDAGDQIVYGEHLLSNEPVLGTWQTPTIENLTYFSDSFLITNDHIGDLWLRARVLCSHSITKAEGVPDHWNAQFHAPYTNSYESLFNPTGHYYQGEAEEWKLTVTAVPEPSSVVLLAMGITGLITMRKRIKQ